MSAEAQENHPPLVLRGLAALQHSMQTGSPLFRRHSFGLRSEKVSTRAGYALWGLGCEQQLYCAIEASS